MHRKWIGLITAVAVASAGTAVAVNLPAAADGGSADATKPSAVGERLKATIDGLRFQDVLDTAPPGSEGAEKLASVKVDKEAYAPKLQRSLLASAADPQPIQQQPQMDATIIELDRYGKPVSSGTVLMSPSYKNGVVVPVDENLSTTSVRWRQWDDEGWYANKGQGTVDVVPGHEDAPLDHMLNYPGSVLKLMVAFGVLRLVDQGKISLDSKYVYDPTEISPLCGEASTNTVRKYLDASLTWSSNAASCALIKLLHDQNAVDPLNQTFQDLGLQTLQLKGTRPSNGGRWGNEVTMSSLDTAKLLTLVNGAPGKVWTAPNGKPVTSDVLSAESRRFFKSTLARQGFNDMLSTTNWCGGDYPAAGMPNATASRWVGDDGTVTIPGQDAKFGRDVRPCNAKAEVVFAHKTGWVSNTAGDSGIVRAPGEGGRRYIISVFSNLGTQYVDANRPDTPEGIYPYSYTEKFGQLGRIMDAYEKRVALTRD